MLFPCPIKIAVIGSAPYDLDRPMGRYIDSCDLVMRFNAYSTEGHEAYVGSKTDIWCFFANVAKSYDKTYERCRELWTVRQFNHPLTWNFHRMAKQCGAELFDVPSDWIESLKAEVGHHFPSTGLVGLYAAIQRYHLYARPIFVQGMGSLNYNTQLHYYNRLERVNRDVRHDARKEKDVLRAWRDRGMIDWVENDNDYSRIL